MAQLRTRLLLKIRMFPRDLCLQSGDLSLVYVKSEKYLENNLTIFGLNIIIPSCRTEPSLGGGCRPCFFMVLHLQSRQYRLGACHPLSCSVFDRYPITSKFWTILGAVYMPPRWGLRHRGTNRISIDISPRWGYALVQSESIFLGSCVCVGFCKKNGNAVETKRDSGQKLSKL